MWISLGTLIILLVFIGLWVQQMKAREIALAVAKKACESKHAQLVDDTVHFKGSRFAKRIGARFPIERRYDFDYSLDGQSRHHGSVLLSGSRLKQVRMEATFAEGAASSQRAVILPFRKREPRNESRS
jgi:hypothetical protein